MIKEKAAMLIEKAKNSYRPRESRNEIQRERNCDKPLQASRISKTLCIEKESFRWGGLNKGNLNCNTLHYVSTETHIRKVC